MQEHFETAVQTLTETNPDAILWTGGAEAQVLSHISREYAGLDLPHLVIDTGNHYPEMYDFRREYADDTGIDVRTQSYDELQAIIRDPSDPRAYHGQWDAEAGVPGHDDIDAPRTQDEWTVAASCGALKVVPMRRFIEDDGFERLVTGVRGDDPLYDDEGDYSVSHVDERRQPAPHTRINPLAEWGEKQVWAYIKREFVPYCDLYDEGYRHTDAVCCTEDDQDIGEHGEGGRDPEKRAAQDKLQEMGYI
jgi:phosphoadenosine phosphosulfate reductase